MGPAGQSIHGPDEDGEAQLQDERAAAVRIEDFQGEFLTTGLRISCDFNSHIYPTGLNHLQRRKSLREKMKV